MGKKTYSYKISITNFDIRIFGDLSDFTSIRDVVVSNLEGKAVYVMSCMRHIYEKDKTNGYIKIPIEMGKGFVWQNGYKLRFTLFNGPMQTDKLYLYNNRTFEETTEVKPKPERRTRGLIKNDKRDVENA